MVGTRGLANPTGQTNRGGHHVGRPKRVITTLDAPGWYFHRYPWSPLGRQADFEAARAMEAAVEFEQTVLRENQRQFVEDVEDQGREFLATN